MKIALLILFLVIVFGTAIYAYLRKEQDKFTPRDKFDEAWYEFYKDKSFNTQLNTPSKRFYLLLKTLGVALLLNQLLIGITGSQYSFYLLLCSPLVIIAFPIGLPNIFHLQSLFANQVIFPILMWLPYFIFFTLGTYTKKPKVFAYIYFVFVILLIMNIIGWVMFSREFDLSGLS